MQRRRPKATRPTLNWDALASHLATGQPRRAEMPSEAALRRLGAVPLLFANRPPGSPRSGQVLFDAWSAGGVAVRDATSSHTRRLTLGAGSILLDLVAWRDEQGWQFTGRARRDGQVSHDFVLQAGVRRLLPQWGGYYQWRSRGVPRLLELRSNETRVVFEPIAWA